MKSYNVTIQMKLLWQYLLHGSICFLGFYTVKSERVISVDETKPL